jgi:outer membrane protein OmpA-like peptidoglycan-associated protein
MKAIKTIKLVGLLCLFLFSTNMQGQKLGKILKKKATEVVDEVLNEDTKKQKDKDEEEVVVVKKSVPIKNFIDGNIVFSDNFNYEREGEFPSKWTQLSGTMQNSQVITQGKKEGVVQFKTSSKMKPTFKNDNYLGNSFKIEIQCYFHGKGNEAYKLNLMNTNDVYKAYQITVRGDGIVPAGSSHEYARMPYKLPYPGWRTVQLSFNNGTIKVLYEGFQLINIADWKKTIKKKVKHIKEYTHIELSALSRSASPAMINHITIAHGGLPLYKRLMNEGRLVFHDILFDNDSYFIKPSSYPAIDRIVTMLKDNSKTHVIIEGHTDANGSNQSNQKLSEYRAKAVMHYIINKGVDGKRMKSVGYGEEKPISLENNEKAWSLNRRVELVLQR